MKEAGKNEYNQYRRDNGYSFLNLQDASVYEEFKHTDLRNSETPAKIQKNIYILIHNKLLEKRKNDR